jgi:hypothetical protein
MIRKQIALYKNKNRQVLGFSMSLAQIPNEVGFTELLAKFGVRGSQLNKKLYQSSSELSLEPSLSPSKTRQFAQSLIDFACNCGYDYRCGLYFLDRTANKEQILATSLD